MSHATIAAPLATHMNANISTPILAPILSECWLVTASFMMMNMTVAMTLATVVQSAAKKVRSMMTRVGQRLRTARGVMKIMTKERQTPVKKRPNIQWEAVRMRPRTELILNGSATNQDVSGVLASGQMMYDLLVAPDNSSLLMICRGLNQYSVFGVEQSVNPSPLFPSQNVHSPTV